MGFVNGVLSSAGKATRRVFVTFGTGRDSSKIVVNLGQSHVQKLYLFPWDLVRWHKGQSQPKPAYVAEGAYSNGVSYFEGLF